jgi:hypothetical protein
LNTPAPGLNDSRNHHAGRQHNDAHLGSNSNNQPNGTQPMGTVQTKNHVLEAPGNHPDNYLSTRQEQLDSNQQENWIQDDPTADQNRRSKSLPSRLNLSRNISSLAGHMNLFSYSYEELGGMPKGSMNNLDASIQKPSSKRAFESFMKLFFEGTFDVKIIDFSNACWSYHHYSKKITTRPNRAPEVILGMCYDHRADIWSAACFFVKLLTGENLFNPRKGKKYTKDDDHLAQIIEVTGGFPSYYINSAPKKKKFFMGNGKLRRINSLKFIDLEGLFIEKYQIRTNFTKSFVKMLKCMFSVMVKDRLSAKNL